MLVRIQQVVLIPVGPQDGGAGLVQAQGAVGVVAKVVGEQDGDGFVPRHLRQLVGGQAGAGVDQQGALGSREGIDLAAVLQEEEVGVDFLPGG